MKNIRLYTFAVLFTHLPTPEKIVVYMKSRDELATSDVKLSSRMQCPLHHVYNIGTLLYIPTFGQWREYNIAHIQKSIVWFVDVIAYIDFLL